MKVLECFHFPSIPLWHTYCRMPINKIQMPSIPVYPPEIKGKIVLCTKKFLKYTTCSHFMEKSSAVFPLMIEFAIVKYLDLKWKSQIFRLHSLFFQHASVHSAKENWHIEFHIMNNVHCSHWAWRLWLQWNGFAC